MRVVAHHRHLAEHLAGFAHAHADFLALLLGENAHRTAPDHVQSVARITGVVDRFAEFEVPRVRRVGQCLQSPRR